MIRVMHERCDLEASEVDRFGDTTWVLKASNVPCEMVPLDSSEQTQRGVAVTTTYQWVTRSTLIPNVQTNWRIIWRGRDFNVVGHVEDYYLRGRLQHRQAVVKFIQG